jgi:hypothetical protein
MIVTVWKGGTYGIRVGHPNAIQHFDQQWKTIEVLIDEEWHEFPLTDTFWTTCPEFRGGPLPEWLKKRGLIPWHRGKPPKLNLLPLGGCRFELKL